MHLCTGKRVAAYMGYLEVLHLKTDMFCKQLTPLWLPSQAIGIKSKFGIGEAPRPVLPGVCSRQVNTVTWRASNNGNMMPYLADHAGPPTVSGTQDMFLCNTLQAHKMTTTCMRARHRTSDTVHLCQDAVSDLARLSATLL